MVSCTFRIPIVTGRLCGPYPPLGNVAKSTSAVANKSDRFQKSHINSSGSGLFFVNGDLNFAKALVETISWERNESTSLVVQRIGLSLSADLEVHYTPLSSAGSGTKALGLSYGGLLVHPPQIRSASTREPKSAHHVRQRARFLAAHSIHRSCLRNAPISATVSSVLQARHV